MNLPEDMRTLGQLCLEVSLGMLLGLLSLCWTAAVIVLPIRLAIWLWRAL